MKAAGEPAAASRYGTDLLFWKMFVKPILYLLYIQMRRDNHED